MPRISVRPLNKHPDRFIAGIVARGHEATRIWLIFMNKNWIAPDTRSSTTSLSIGQVEYPLRQYPLTLVTAWNLARSGFI
jgi:hypothetical protein